METLIDFRKQLHQYPEVAGEELVTAKSVKQFLTQFFPTHVIDEIGGHGLVAIYDFGKTGPNILFRCELDALPIEEPNTFSYRSKNAGASHKCGHDGHMTMVAGLAPWLQQQSFKKGRVILLFQPAEETGEGAQAMLDDPKFESIIPDYVFALHNIPGVAMHQVLWVRQQFSATVQSMTIRFHGQQSHAAEPEHGCNPAWAMAEITTATQAWSESDPTSANFALITPVYTVMGQREYGISAGYGELHFTLRTWSVSRMEQLLLQFENQLKATCEKYQLNFDTSLFEYFPATLNSDEANRLIVEAAGKAGLEVVEKEQPFKFGEDFGGFTQKYPGAMFGLGAGIDTPVLHNDYYDFPDELIDSGLAVFKGIIEQLLAD